MEYERFEVIKAVIMKI